MANLTSYRDQIRFDSGVKGNVDWGDTRLLRMINLAQRYIQGQLNGLGFKRWETSLPVVLSSATHLGVSVKKFGMGQLAGILESPRSIPMIFVDTGTVYGVAYPKDNIPFNFDIIDTYSAPTIKDAIFTRLANSVLLSPVAITNASAVYYKAIRDLVETDVSITDAISVAGVTTITAVNHGLATGDTITISGVIGMTDLNGTWQITVTASNTFTVALTTSQNYSSGGSITADSQIPIEFEEYLIRKAVMEIKALNGNQQVTMEAQRQLEDAIKLTYQNFYGDVQNEQFNTAQTKTKV